MTVTHERSRPVAFCAQGVYWRPMKRGLALALIALLAVPAGAAVGPSGVLIANDRIDTVTPVQDGDDTDVRPMHMGTDDVDDRSLQTANGTNVTRTRLELSGTPRHNSTRLSFDLGSTIALDDSELASKYQMELDGRRLRQADDRGRVMGRILDRIDARIDALRARERAAAAAYARNDISHQEFARRLVLIAAEARDLGNQLQALESPANSRETTRQIESMSSRPTPFTGTAHRELETGLRGASTSPVSVAASDGGYVLGTIDRDDGSYYRHGIRFDNRNSDGPVTIETTGEALDRLRALYPETETTGVFIPSIRRETSAGLYEVNVNYPEGSVTLYLDAATESVFYEVRELEVDAMPRTTVINETSADVRVVVERTNGNGPALVKTMDAETGTPIGVALSIDDRRIGDTGPDGKLWSLAPPGTFELGVSSGETRFNVTVPSS